MPSRYTLAGRGLAVVSACLLVGVCVLCARWGLADLIEGDASARLSALQDRAARTGEAADAREAGAIGQALQLARRYDSRNPATAELLGSVFALNVRDGEAAGAISSQRARALEQYVDAVAMRPTSPYAWANLAWTKFYLGQVDDAFYRALGNAMRLGPWEPEVQFVAVDLGLALWDELPAAMRPEILVMVQNGQRRNATQIIAIAQRRGRLVEVCKFEKLTTMAACKAVSG